MAEPTAIKQSSLLYNPKGAYAELTMFESRNDNIDLENKFASFDALNKYELYELSNRKKHRIYRDNRCRWCGSTPRSFWGVEEKNYCDAMCNKRFNYFMAKIDGRIIGSRNMNMPEARMFIEYCKVQILLKRPAKQLNERLKYVTMYGLPLPLIQKPKFKQK